MKVICEFAFIKSMLDRPDMPHWPTLLRPLSEASTALGHLAHTLETTPLHPAWLWRETARASAKISQISGHRVRAERLMLHLAGVPLDPAEDDTGLAAARRIFLMAAPLFQASEPADSKLALPELFSPLWPRRRLERVEGEEAEDDGQPDDGAGEGRELVQVVRELAGFAGSGARPKLIDLLLDLRRHGPARRLPPGLVRLALPLALHRSGVVPKAAPGLLGGRLPLAPRSSEEAEPITPWLARGLSALAKEASDAARRLAELDRQHRAWHALLAEAGLRGHARAPAVLDLLATTPVLSASLVARHLGCSPQGAGAMLKRLSDFGIVSEATVRSRWKIYLAGDLALSEDTHDEAERPLAFSDPAPAIDREAIEAALAALIGDLERVERRAQAVLAEGGGPLRRLRSATRTDDQPSRGWAVVRR